MTPGRRHAARGFALVGALFLLTVLAALASWTVTVSSVQHVNALLGPLSARAHYAARGGVEWAAWQIVANGAAGLSCPGTTSLALTEAALAGFQVSVACNAQAVSEGARSHTLYSLDVVASLGSAGDMDHVSRTLHVDIAF